MTPTEKKVLSLIRVIRESFPEAKIAYTYGGCYGFYKILKSLFPTAEAYETSGSDEWEEGGHIVSKIGDKYYDITGIMGLDEIKPKKYPLSEEEHENWNGNVYGMRIEEMIKRKFSK